MQRHLRLPLHERIARKCSVSTCAAARLPVDFVNTPAIYFLAVDRNDQKSNLLPAVI